MRTAPAPAFKRLIIVAYRLPYRFIRNNERTKVIPNSGGLVSAVLSLSQKLQLPGSGESRMPIHWIGKGEDIPSNILMKQLADLEFTLHPVSIPAHLHEKYYSGFCNNTIWPLFHYFPWLTNFKEEQWQSYIDANQLFADELEKIVQPGDFVWIHDYQLLLLPALIRKSFPESVISYFMHIPFPSFEIFRLIPRKWREAILSGILGADLIGFHTQAYARYFYLSVRNSIIIKTKSKNDIIYQGRKISIHAFPLGVDYEKFNNDCKSSKSIREKQKILKSLNGKKLIFSIDRLDYTKGLLHRLHAFETFLENNHIWHENVIFNMVVIPSRDSIAMYQEMKKEIEATIGRINGRFSNLSWRPISYQYRSLTHHELIALYDMSDVGLITPLRDGMNLVAKEFIACQVQNQGVLILSEMTGASVELPEAIIINPYDQNETADAIREALEMKKEIKENNIRLMQLKLRKNNVINWATAIFEHTQKIRNYNV